jgi:acetyl-CoA acetyltransferase
VRRAAIMSPLRTPVGTFGGALRDVPVEDLAATVVRAVLAGGVESMSRIEYYSTATRWGARAGTVPLQVLAILEGWGGYDQDRLNVNGSGISLGHPIAATGMRMVTTLLHELRRRGGGQGLVTMCVGGGQGLAAMVEAA